MFVFVLYYYYYYFILVVMVFNVVDNCAQSGIFSKNTKNTKKHKKIIKKNTICDDMIKMSVCKTGCG